MSEATEEKPTLLDNRLVQAAISLYGPNLLVLIAIMLFWIYVAQPVLVIQKSNYEKVQDIVSTLYDTTQALERVSATNERTAIILNEAMNHARNP
jgi:ABC-type uncharacterized transport system permease subunit